ncbi:MAG: hypothetical protein ACOC6H_02505 [Thermoproteota archaeon]
MSTNNKEKPVIHINDKEVPVLDKISFQDQRWNKTRTLKFQEVGDLEVLHYRDQDTGEPVYVKYLEIQEELKINAYLQKEGKIINIATQQPIQETPP